MNVYFACKIISLKRYNLYDIKLNVFGVCFKRITVNSVMKSDKSFRIQRLKHTELCIFKGD